MSRKLPDWLNAYIEYTRETEPPLSYHIWVGISILAGALERRCVFPWGHSKIYPNLYVVLIGPSGQSRKGEAINIGKSFMQAGEFRLAAESLSKESLIRSINEANSSYVDQHGAFKLQSPINVVSEELIVFLRQKDVDLMGWLTNWYDSRDVWTYQTKHSGSDSVTGLCVNFLGGTAPDWLPSMIPQEAIGGGWTSRCIFVVEEYKGKTVPDPSLYPPDLVLKEKLEDDLLLIKDLSGEFSFTPTAKEVYKRWYADADREEKLGRPPIPDPNFKGYNSRRATHIKKVCMALSASRGGDLQVTLEDFNRARMLMETAEKKMPMAFGGLGKSEFAQQTMTLIEVLKVRKTMKRSELLRLAYRDIDSWTLEKIQRCLVEMKIIKTEVTRDQDVIYTYVGATQALENLEAQSPSHAPPD